MKRFIAIILAVFLLTIPLSTTAANEVFVGINNAMLPLHDAMPLSSGGAWYMDYMDFTRGDLGISASYNKDLGTVVLYNWDTTLVFNINEGTASCDNMQYKQRTFSKNGTIYVPVAFVCARFGITFSYLSEASTIRLRTTSSMSDSMFVYIAKNRIPDLLSAYNASKQPSFSAPPDNTGNNSSSNENTSSNETQDASRQFVYITVDVTSSDNISEILELLNTYNLSATLFLSENAMQDDNLTRKICASRHSVGIYANSIDKADDANHLLFVNAKTKSRLLRADTVITGAESAGYRQWGANVDARKRSAAQINSLIDKRTSSVVRLDNSDTSLSRMRQLFSHINSKKFNVRTLDVMLTPTAP